jgi:hypothetical protein
MLALQKEMLKTKKKFGDLLERYKDLDLVYVNNKLKEYENLVQYELYYVPNDRWKILMLNWMNDGSWWKCNSRKKCIRIWLHTRRIRTCIKGICLLL